MRGQDSGPRSGPGSFLASEGRRCAFSPAARAPAAPSAAEARAREGALVWGGRAGAFAVAVSQQQVMRLCNRPMVKGGGDV